MIEGRNILIYEDDVVVAAAKSCTINNNAEALENSSPASGTARSYTVGRTGWDISISTLVLGMKDHLLKVGQAYRMVWKERGNDSDTMQGTAICTNAQVAATVGNLAQGSFQFLGSDDNGTIVTPPTPTPSDYVTEQDVVNIINQYDFTTEQWVQNYAGIANGVITIGNNSITPLTANSSLAWGKLTGKPTTLSGYGITDAKIANGVITLGSSTITPVTIVAMSVPTGFSVTGSPITKTGTLALSYASGYEGFTTALKNKIEEIYSWFEVDANGDIKTKNTAGGHVRGFYTESFVSALGSNSSGGGAGGGTVTGIIIGSGNPILPDSNGSVTIPAYPTSLAWSAITGKPTTISGYGITDALSSSTKYAASSSVGGAATSATKLTNTTKIGDTNQPVYFTANGVPTAISYTIGKSVPSDAVFTDTTYKLTLNGTTNGASGGTSLGSFYAPTASGTANQVLISGGSNTAPSWTAQSNLSVGDSSKLNGQAASYYATASSVTTLQGYFTSGAANNVVTTADTTNTLYVVGVTSSATTTLKRDTSITIKGNALSAGSVTTTGNVSIGGTLGVTGATTLSSTLSVASGITLTTTKKIYFGDTSHYLELNSTGFHFSHGVYSDSFVSALGANSSGGGGGGGTVTGIKLASNSSAIQPDANGIITIPAATTSAFGVIKVGSTLSVSSGTLNLKASGVTANTYRSVTVDTYGRVTAGTNPTTLAGYGITDAYTKTASDGRFMRISDYTDIGATSSSTVSCNSLTTYGVYKNGSTSTASSYVTDRPINSAVPFRLVVERTSYASNPYIRQRYQSFNSNVVYERYSSDTGANWSDWVKVQDNLANYATASSLNSYLPLSGGQMTGVLTWKNSTALSGVTSTSYVLCIDGFADGGATHYILTSNLSVGNATNATNAATATKATQDGSGNVITSTYLTAIGRSGDYLTQTKGGTTSNVTHILERNGTYTHSIGATGWYRIGRFLSTASQSASCIFLLSRTYAYKGNESYAFSITLSYSGKISISQLAGYYHSTQLIDKIRVEYVTDNSSFYVPIDIHVNEDTTGSNTYRVTFIGGAQALSEFEKDPTLTGSTFEYDMRNGMGTAIRTTDAIAVTTGNSNGVVGLLASTNRGLYDHTKSTWIVGTNGTNTWLSQGNVGIGTDSPSYKLDVSGTLGVTGKSTMSGCLNITGSSDGYDQGIRIHDVGTTSSIWFRCANASGNDAGMIGITGNTSGLLFRLPSASTGTSYSTYMFIAYGGNVGIGNTSPSQKLHVTGNILASGEITASSDERKKNIISDTKFNVRDIASARSILYEWNDDRDKDNEKKIHGGSIAQDWLGKADSFLSQDNDGWYSINYGALALCSAITIAKEVVKHEDRITILEKENAKLKARVAELEERRA